MHLLSYFIVCLFICLINVFICINISIELMMLEGIHEKQNVKQLQVYFYDYI